MQMRNITLAISMAANLYFAYQLHTMESLKVMIDKKVGEKIPDVSKRAFRIGCEVAAQGLAGRHSSDTDWSLYEDWCKTNSEVYAPRK